MQVVPYSDQIWNTSNRRHLETKIHNYFRDVGGDVRGGGKEDDYKN